MVDCKYCEEEFENEQEMHLHWGEAHEDELTSHDKEKVKKARREKEKEKESQAQRRRKMAGKALAVGGALIVAVVLGQQALNSMGGGQTGSFDLEGQPMLGNDDANITVVEFGDYSCSHCRNFDVNVKPQLKEDYIDSGQANYYYVNYAFLGDASTEAAVASECVYQQDKDQFWDYHSALFTQQQNPEWGSTDLLVDVAEQNTEGLDYGQLRQCIEGSETLNDVQSDNQQASNNGVTGTPTIYVNDRKLPNYEYATVRAAIEQELG